MDLRGHPDGSNVTLVNTYYKRFYDEQKQYRDLLTMVYRDLDTGQKYKEEILDPEITYYIAKPEHRVPYNRLFAPESELEAKTCRKKELSKAVAKDLGLSDYYYDCVKSGDRQGAEMVHSHPDVFGTDINIEDYYRQQFARKYVNASYAPTKAYFDIEVDSINMLGDFPEPGECPINAITIVMDEINTVYTLALRNPRNPLIAEFEEFVKKDRLQTLKKFVIDHVNKRSQHEKYGGPSLAEKYGIDKLQFKAIFFDEDQEIELIRSLFRLINKYRPDFVLAWNMGFDIPYIIARIQALGYDPRDIMCDPEFKYPYAEYYVDEKNKNEFAERGDFAVISSYSAYLDQMIQYASRRKGQTRPLSYGLDYIGELVAKVNKLDYKEITVNISELPYVNYLIFFFYNVCDTISQKCIECVVEDIDFVFSKALINNTRYAKVHRQTVYLVNRGRKEFYESDNVIMGNNFNRQNEKPTQKFPGAFVADPEKVSDYSKVRIYERPVSVFDNLYDSDYASLYPNLIGQFNIAPNTQIGKVYIGGEAGIYDNRRHNDQWDRAGSFFEDYHTHNWVIVGVKWFGLLGIEDLYTYVVNFFNTMMMPSSMLGFQEGPRKYWQPIIFYDQEGYSPFVYSPPMNTARLEEFKAHVAATPNQRF